MNVCIVVLLGLHLLAILWLRRSMQRVVHALRLALEDIQRDQVERQRATLLRLQQHQVELFSIVQKLRQIRCREEKN